MPPVLLCEPCQQFLRNHHIRNHHLLHSRSTYDHHLTAESFSRALQIPCAICTRLRLGFLRHVRDSNTSTGSWSPSKTTYKPLIIGNIQFHCSGQWACLEFVSCSDSSRAPSWLTAAAEHDRILAAKNTGSDSCLDFVLSQFRNCLDTHLTCRALRQEKRQPGTFMPTRIIDVGPEGGMVVSLSERNGKATIAPYIALSHCWGKIRPFVLTQVTLGRLKAGIPVTDLPKTFQDAILVARKLQIQYLWVDSLCIFQDSLEDWQKEAACMRQVYSQAVCCIAATAAENGDMGLFFDRDPRALVPIQVDLYWKFKSGAYWCSCEPVNTTTAIDAAPLNSRAWVAQERYLSMGIVHFAREMVYWDCHECFAPETHPQGERYDQYELGSHNTLSGLGDSRSKVLKSLINRARLLKASATHQAANMDPSLQPSNLYYTWNDFIQYYSHSNLTKEGDILVALNGVAQDVASIVDDVLVAGLWKGQLLAQMYWHCDTNAKPRAWLSSWRAPSWSWASVNRPVLFYPGYGSSPISYMAEIQSLSVEQRSSGELVHASVSIKCRLIPFAWLKEGHTLDLPPYRVSPIFDDCNFCPSTKGESLARDLSLVILQGTDDDEFTSYGIVVAPSLSRAGSYERVGAFDNFNADTASKIKLVDAYITTEYTIIELV